MERQPSGKCDRHGALLRQLLVSHGGGSPNITALAEQKYCYYISRSLRIPRTRVTEATTSWKDYYHQVHLSVMLAQEEQSLKLWEPEVPLHLLSSRRAGVGGLNSTYPVVGHLQSL